MDTHPHPTPTPFQTKGELAALLASKLPLNSHELPDGIFRTDLLPSPETIEYLPPKTNPHNLVNPQALIQAEFPPDYDYSDPNNFDEVSLSQIHQSYIPLSYADGYPIQPNGFPVWERLSFEPPECYRAFEDYLEQGNHSARQIHTLIKTSDSKSDPVSTRSGPPSEQLTSTKHEMFEWANLYFWRLRSRAYDLFQVAFERHLRAKRAVQFQDDSYITSVRLANIAETYLTSPACGAEMNPKIALDALRLSQQMGRDALGLSKTRNSGGGKGGGSDSSEITIDIKTQLQRLGVQEDDIDPKTIAELEKRGISLTPSQKRLLRNNTAGLSGTVIDAESGEIDDINSNAHIEKQILDELLQNEELDKTAQDIVL